jgi:hypothetical protein
MMKKKEELPSSWRRPRQKVDVEPVAEEQGEPVAVPAPVVLVVDPVVPVVNFLMF